MKKYFNIYGDDEFLNNRSWEFVIIIMISKFYIYFLYLRVEQIEVLFFMKNLKGKKMIDQMDELKER